MEEDHSFLFLNKNLMKIFFFFFLNLENLNFSKGLKILELFFGIPEFFFLKELKILEFFFFF